MTVPVTKTVSSSPNPFQKGSEIAAKRWERTLGEGSWDGAGDGGVGDPHNGSGPFSPPWVSGLSQCYSHLHKGFQCDCHTRLDALWLP